MMENCPERIRNHEDWRILNPVDFGVGLEELKNFNTWKTESDQRGHMTGKMEGREFEFLVDTGATLSLLNFTLKESRTTHKIVIDGVTGQKEQNLSKSFLVTTGNKSIWGRFVLVEDLPACLFGRDLLQVLDVELRLSPEGIDLIIMGISVISRCSNNELKILE
ncbi:hypothetical protein llap_15187 [Limosa lapponica baueri]|uniref:Peptidase A2 domain-containing protein n=1 Tax=Limosa lapponica baueri TaxID=1758121 RepID=A0A2I0TL23_LIMLA|nr:hypothetical protein llap_15187 [Limosa lapponica baueri]